MRILRDEPGTYRLLFVAVFILALVRPQGHAFGQALGMEIHVAADVSEITVGDPVTYTVTVEWDPSQVREEPVLEENLGVLVIRERRAPLRESLDDGRARLVKTFSLTSYQVGEYQIPPPLVRYLPREGEARILSGEPISLKVRAIAPEDATDIRDIKPPRAIPRDLRPAALFAAGVLLALGLLVALIVFLIRRSRGRAYLPPPEPPFDAAMRRLSALRRASLATAKDRKHYYVELSDILRGYLDGRFSLPAPLLTTRQLRELIEDGGEPEKTGEVFVVLDRSDLVKFARFDPGESDREGDYDRVLGFVRATRPPVDNDEVSKKLEPRSAQ